MCAAWPPAAVRHHVRVRAPGNASASIAASLGAVGCRRHLLLLLLLPALLLLVTFLLLLPRLLASAASCIMAARAAGE
jgi:hypothetical protein